jgi:hypothetical protein
MGVDYRQRAGRPLRVCHDPGNPLPPTAVTSTAPPERSAPPTAPDVRTLSLAQLHRLAEGGSRRARAELERRMREPGPAAAGPAPHAPSVAAATPGSARPRRRPGPPPHPMAATRASTPGC